MGLLQPDWNQQRPTWKQAQLMASRIPLTQLPMDSAAFENVIARLRESHSNGGAIMALFKIGEDSDFDWFASRNRLHEEDILSSLLSRPEVIESLPELQVPPNYKSENSNSGFGMQSPFLIDGNLAAALYMGGAYWHRRGDGRTEKQLALSWCEAMFGFRYSEILYYANWDAWTPWFHDVAWDATHVVFDSRERKLWIWAITDTD